LRKVADQTRKIFNGSEVIRASLFLKMLSSTVAFRWEIKIWEALIYWMVTIIYVVVDMEFYDVIKTRRSVRSYKPDPIPDDVLKRVLDAARIAPSGSNRQPWKFIVVRDEETKRKLVSACHNQSWMAEAPVIIVACALPSEAWVRSDGEEYWKVDVAIAMQDLILEAWELGLGTCWIGSFREEEVKRILGIPDEVRVVALTPLGYPAEEKGPVTRRKPLEEIASYNHW